MEQIFDGPLRARVDDVLRSASELVTTRDVLFESYSFILKRTRREPIAREWYMDATNSRVNVLDPRLEEVNDAHAAAPKDSGLSLVDLSLAWAARRRRATKVATGDSGFRSVGLDPLFALP